MTHQDAHDLLDAVRDGADFSTAQITEALRITGDLTSICERALTQRCQNCGCEWSLTSDYEKRCEFGLMLATGIGRAGAEWHRQGANGKNQ